MDLVSIDHFSIYDNSDGTFGFYNTFSNIIP